MEGLYPMRNYAVAVVVAVVMFVAVLLIWGQSHMLNAVITFVVVLAGGLLLARRRNQYTK